VCTSSTISCPIRFGDPKNFSTPQLRHGEAWTWKPEELDAWFASGGTSKANRCEVDHDLTMGLKLENCQNLLLKWKITWIWYRNPWIGYDLRLFGIGKMLGNSRIARV
jgi:hypothetical protein